MISPELMIRSARSAARSLSGDIDHDDLEGFIIEQLLKRDPKSRIELRRLIRWAVVDWVRLNLGRNGHKSHIAYPVSLQSDVVVSDSEVDVSLMDTVGSLDLGFERDAIQDQHVEDWIRGLPWREQKIIRLRSWGYSQAEIGKELGLDDSRISQICSKLSRRARLKKIGLGIVVEDDGERD